MHEIERFEARSESGERHTIITWQEMVQGVRGLKQMTTLDGGPVNYVDEDHVRIVRTWELLTRVR